MVRSLAELDFSGLRFPSDSLTIGALRRTHRELFDLGVQSGSTADDQPQFFFQPDKPGHAQEQLAYMLYIERILAANAYAQQVGIAPPPIHVGLNELEDQLTELYLHHDLAKGPQHAAELLRDLERQGRSLAAAQAR